MLLSKDNAIPLGILRIDPDGDHADKEADMRVRCITPEHLEDPIKNGKRPIPIQLREVALKKLKWLKKHDLIEGLLPPPLSAKGGSPTW